MDELNPVAGPTDAEKLQHAARQATINRDIGYLIAQVDRAVSRQSPIVRVRTDALITMLDVIAQSVTVAKTQRRWHEQGFWRSFVELLRRF